MNRCGAPGMIGRQGLGTEGGGVTVTGVDQDLFL